VCVCVCVCVCAEERGVVAKISKSTPFNGYAKNPAQTEKKKLRDVREIFTSTLEISSSSTTTASCTSRIGLETRSGETRPVQRIRD